MLFCCSVDQSCPTLCDCMDCSMPGFPVLHHLPAPDGHSNACPLNWWCHQTISFSVIPFSCLQSFPASGSFPVSQFFTSGGLSIRALASASILPMNIQGWFPLGLTALISLLPKGFSRVFSSTFQKHHFFGNQPSLWSSSHIHILYWKNHHFDCKDLCWQSDVSVFYILSRFLIGSLPRSKHLLISWLHHILDVVYQVIFLL